jgi:hypothetical protein
MMALRLKVEDIDDGRRRVHRRERRQGGGGSFKMTKFLNILLSAINLVLFGAGAYYFLTRGIAQNQGWSPVELVTIMLAALGVMVTVLTLFVAVLAIWGFGRLSEEARDKAGKVARDVAERETRDYLDKSLPEMIEQEVERRVGSDQGYGAGAAKGNDDANDS